MNPARILEILTEAGVDVTDLDLQRREGRMLARLRDGRMAWFALNAAGKRRLDQDRRILRLIEVRCDFRAPRVLAVGQDGWDLRDPVPGVCEPAALYRRVLADPDLARRLGADIGRALAEQHTGIGAQDLSGWLPRRVSWPMATRRINARLPRATDDAALIARAGRALALYRAQTVGEADRVLAHCDLGLHNIAFDPATDRLAGIFDYDGAAFADRHHDFRYLIFEGGHDLMLEGALAAYEPATGVTLDRDRIRIYHAACAIGFLAFRAGHAPEEPWCGRTLSEDLAWTDGALTAIGL